MESKRKPRRSKISSFRDIMTTDCPPNKVRRWVNDVNNRVSLLQEDGWKVVSDNSVKVGDKGVTNQNQAVGAGARRFVGNNTSAILMEIDKDLYTEYEDARHAEIRETTAELKRNLNSGKDGTYGKVSIS